MTKMNFISAKETAEMLDININTLYRIINNDPDFPAIRLGKSWRVNADRLPDWINAQIDNRTGKAHNGINGDAVKRKE